MNTFFKTHEETIEAASQAKQDSKNTHLESSNFFCECGESFALYLRDDETLERTEGFVWCHSCHCNYE